MKNRLLLLAAVIGLYLVSSYALHMIYGPSYPFLGGENCWMPDGSGGWRALGSPVDPMPTIPSENVPLLLNYLPIFLPAIVMVLFLFTPLRYRLEPRPVEKSEDEDIASSDRSDL